MKPRNSNCSDNFLTAADLWTDLFAGQKSNQVEMLATILEAVKGTAAAL